MTAGSGKVSTGCIPLVATVETSGGETLRLPSDEKKRGLEAGDSPVKTGDDGVMYAAGYVFCGIAFAVI
jgi:hypothetical protein